MNMQYAIKQSFTAAVLGVALACAGCAGGDPDTMLIKAGTFDVQDKNVLTPGDVPAMKQLADAVKGNAKAKMFIVEWENNHPLGSKFSRIYIYDRKAGTLTDSANNYGWFYTGVTDAFLQTLATSGQSADGLIALGAKQVSELPASGK